MRTILKIIAAPFILALILAVAVLSFLSCVAGAVCVVACVGLSLLAILCLPRNRAKHDKISPARHKGRRSCTIIFSLIWTAR